MSNDLALPTEKLISVMQASVYPGASVESVKMVIDYCIARKLDPMLHPVHIVPMWDSKTKTMHDVVMPGLNLYRTQAAQSGQLGGISEPMFGPEKEFNFGGHKMKAPEWCKVAVKRLMGNAPAATFSAIEFLEEAISTNKSGEPTPMWIKRPRGMLAKTAESQALRKAFPDINSSETAEEMDGKSYFEEQNVAQAVESRVAIEAKEQAKKGSAAFLAYWKSVSKEDRQAIKAAYPDCLKSVCEEADKNIVEA